MNLSDELFIVQELTKENSPLIDSEEFLALSTHLQAAASIDVSRFPTAIEELTAKYDSAGSSQVMHLKRLKRTPKN